MVETNASAEVVVAIVFGVLQLIVAIVALWQQHYLRRAACMSVIIYGVTVEY